MKKVLLGVSLLLILTFTGCSVDSQIEKLTDNNSKAADIQKQKELENKINCNKDAEVFRLKTEEKIKLDQANVNNNDFMFNGIAGEYQYKFNASLNTCLFYGSYEGETIGGDILTEEYIYDVYTNNQVASYSFVHASPGHKESRSDNQLAKDYSDQQEFMNKRKELFVN